MQRRMNLKRTQQETRETDEKAESCFKPRVEHNPKRKK